MGDEGDFVPQTWGTSSPDSLLGLCPWTPPGDFRPPDLLSPLSALVLAFQLILKSVRSCPVEEGVGFAVGAEHKLAPPRKYFLPTPLADRIGWEQQVRGWVRDKVRAVVKVSIGVSALGFTISAQEPTLQQWFLLSNPV